MLCHRVGGVAQVVESLASKHEAESSNPSTNKKENKTTKTKKYFEIIESRVWLQQTKIL
jgi:hypothetical protein